MFRSVKRKLAAAAVGLVAFAAILVGVAAPAQAAIGDCPGGVACVWTDVNWDGHIFVIPVGIAGINKCWNFGTPIDNAVSSAYSTYGSGLVLHLYADAHCSTVHGGDLLFSGYPKAWNSLTNPQGDIFSSYMIKTS